MTKTETQVKWRRIEDGYAADAIAAAIFDNGGGLGSAKDGGRWAVVLHGKWIANVDTLADAKRFAQEQT